MKWKRVDKVVQWRLCSGCGACVPACPNKAIYLIDVPDDGIRPKIVESKFRECGDCIDCIKVCPGIGVHHQPFNVKAIPQLLQSWGPVLEVWEGYANDEEIRFGGSSGGVATALALFCIEKKKFAGALHIGTKPRAPLQNVPVLSKSREELLKYTGSRYSPAAPCEKLNWIEESDSSCVFIGKPCDVAALRKSQVVNPRLSSKIGLAISIFCAGTPSTAGTYKLLEILGVKPDEVKEIRYRGRGWPGTTAVKMKDNGEIRQMSYEESWGNVLSKYVQFRCRLCSDGTGEFADISCGDPWYRPTCSEERGISLVLVRTEQGREILNDAINSGCLKLEKVDPRVLALSQKGLLNKRRSLWGRFVAMRISGVPVPDFRGVSLYRNYLALPFKDKVRSIFGTFCRIATRGWRKPLPPLTEENTQGSSAESINKMCE